MKIQTGSNFGAVRFSQDFSCKNLHARILLRNLAKVLPKILSLARLSVRLTQDVTRILKNLAYLVQIEQPLRFCCGVGGKIFLCLSNNSGKRQILWIYIFQKKNFWGRAIDRSENVSTTVKIWVMQVLQVQPCLTSRRHVCCVFLMKKYVQMILLSVLDKR